MSHSPFGDPASPDLATTAALKFDDVQLDSCVSTYNRLLSIILVRDPWWDEFRQRVDGALAGQRLHPALHVRFETVWAVKTLWKSGNDHSWKTVDRIQHGHSASMYAWCADLLDTIQDCLDVVRDSPEGRKEGKGRQKERREKKEKKWTEEWEQWTKEVQERARKGREKEETPVKKQLWEEEADFT